MELSHLQGTIREWAERKGWAEDLRIPVWPMPSVTGMETVGSALARIALEHAGLSERVERIRKGGRLGYLPVESKVVELLTHLDNARPRVNFDLIGVLKKLALVHTEVTESVEAAIRHALDPDSDWLWFGEDGKPEGLASELADIVIRCFQLAGDLGLNLAGAIEAKLAYNERRAYRHGGRLA